MQLLWLITDLRSMQQVDDTTTLHKAPPPIGGFAGLFQSFCCLLSHQLILTHDLCTSLVLYFLLTYA